ncbi:hypothetical protein HYH03_013990 [Edaphochlamys debaryana]|uniref:ethanolamine kinase n=1 Tax=Edaphochlamys debaryana TaxID=47281 RepID=A0A836BU03_9CHLO|nr:hypothetical protein HYH03_013990 [Edaphochlamys debaryana]|eukprot:KAG2487423.1 hypothetical protein HYH03_013990 [Edaphochlamys debaryana]
MGGGDAELSCGPLGSPAQASKQEGLDRSSGAQRPASPESALSTGPPEEVSKVSGGISNLLVKVQPPAPLRPVAVKVFGDKTELLIDREAEKRTLLQLNALGFGAPVVGLFENGRVEAFLDCITLNPEQMADPRFVPHIASRLRSFHELPMAEPPGLPSAADAFDSTLAAEGQAAADGSRRSASGSGASAAVAAVAAAAAAAEAAAPGYRSALPRPSPQSSQWDAIFGWLEMAEALTFDHDPKKAEAFAKVDFPALRKELSALWALCRRVRSPRVFCHNDLLSGNILIVHGEPPPAGAAASAPPASSSAGAADDVLGGGWLQFIDFEYSCYGERGFDLGNHFNEYAGFDCEYGRFPTPEQQKAFFRSYLRPGELRDLAIALLASSPDLVSASAQSSAPASALAPGSPAGQPGPSPGPEGPGSGPDGPLLAAAEALVLDRLVAEACVFALASHAYWGVWSYIQARYSPIDFDYLSYSELRWAEYRRRREEFLGLVDRCFPQGQGQGGAAAEAAQRH